MRDSRSVEEPLRFHLAEPVQWFVGLTLSGCLLVLAAGLGWGFAHSAWLPWEQVTPVTPPFEVDLNSACWPELAQLPGIGQTLAGRIIDYRGSRGPFRDVEQLLDVKGIGPRTLERIRGFLVIDATSAGAVGPDTSR